jgi:sortase A
MTRDDSWINGEDVPPKAEGSRRRGTSRRGASGPPTDTRWRKRRGVRRALNTLSVVLVLGGVGLLAFPFATNMWADHRQGELASEFGTEELRTAYVQRTIKPGQALTRLTIPKLGVDTIVVEGTTPSALRAGSGHYENTALPCEPGNAGIAGHRTTYSKPFANIDKLRPGDQIILETPIGKCWYEVEKMPWTTGPFDWTIVKNVGGARLTMSACHPPGSAAQRLVVRSKLVRTQFRAEDGTFVDAVQS